MKRSVIAAIVLSSAIFVSCGKTESKPHAHQWIYSTDESTKTCSVCEVQEEFTPSGYKLNATEIEYEGSKPYFNSSHILCTDTESTYEKFNESKSSSFVKQLIESGKAFYVEPDTTCDILEDTNTLEPQYHIVITSGEHNGEECWTAKMVVVTDEGIENYLEWKKKEAEKETAGSESEAVADSGTTKEENAATEPAASKAQNSSGASSSTSSKSKSSSSSSSSNNMKIVSDSDSDYWYAVTAAQNLVKEKLKSPSTAKFPIFPSEYVVRRSGDKWSVAGYVEAQNGFGATVKQAWSATFTMGSTKGSQYKISDYSVTFQ